MVHNETHCPRFSVVHTSAVAGTPFEYTVRITNDDRNGSVAAFLRATNITCCLETCDFDGTVVDDEIVCAEVQPPWSYFSNSTRALVMYVYVTFDGVKLRYDEEIEYYYPIYDRGCVAERRDEGCVTCLWNDRDGGGHEYAHYLKWCPAENRCTGSYQVYDKREARSHEKSRADNAVRVECADLEVRSFEPVYAPRTGGTTMRIAVRNHRMLAEEKTIGVTVAGRECANPVTAVDSETIIVCTVIVTDDPLALQQVGPVRVAYASSAASTFTLTSADSFVFVDPVATTVRPVCGSPDGGTLLTVAGRFLDAGTTVRVSVVTGYGDDEAAITCETVARDRDSITCRTGAGGTAGARGRVRVEFDGHLRTYAASTFAYVADDPAVDAGQTFESIVSGGIGVPVRGRHLTCLKRAVLYVIDRDGDRRYAAARCRVRDDLTMVCPAPRLYRVLFTAETSAVLHYGVMARDFAGQVFDLLPSSPHGPAAAAFVLHADPVYTDFETDLVSATLTINGPGRGYRAEDVDVRLRRNSTGTACAVTEVAPDRVVCALTMPPADLEGVSDSIVVTVGDRFVGDVTKKTVGGSVADPMRTLSASCGVFIAVLVTVLIALLFTSSAVLFRLKMKKQYTLK